MGFLKNTWVRYVERSYEQIKDAVLNKLGYKVPEITDHNESNVYVREIEIFAGMHEMLGYYVDNMARETFIDSARLYSSLISKSKLMDYKVTGYVPYSTFVVFTTPINASSQIIIPAGTILATATGIQFVTLNVGLIEIGATVSKNVPVAQFQSLIDVPVGTSQGLSNQEIVFDQKIAHNSLSLKFGGVQWTPVDTLAYSIATDTVYVQTIDKDQNVIAYTGDANIHGAIPAAGVAILATYKITLGLDGFADVGQINTIVTAIPGNPTLSVSNPAPTTGASNPESIDKLKTNIPLSIKTLMRAVTRQDYIDVATMAPSVIKAGVDFHCGKNVDVYIVPDGGGVASDVLIQNTQDWMDERKMVTTNVVVKPAGEVHIKVTANVTANSTYYNNVVLQNLVLALTDFLSYKNQEIGGTVYLSDLYEVIENTEGVLNSEIIKFYEVPYAFPLNTSNPLDWDVDVNNTSVVQILWNIVFLSPTTFQLIRNSALIGVFNVGSQVNQYEISFTIHSANYANGDIYQFTTYPYNSNRIIVEEPSLPVATIDDLNLNVTGGL
jgi:uncharacterized phage protein gp47/JayE